MGDTTDGPSSAAQRAQDDHSQTQQGGFINRLFSALSPSESERPPQTTKVSESRPQPPMLGMLNLRRMRVEEVMVPKADITAIPVGIVKDDLVKVFRDSGLTRLPIFDGTLDTPLGFVNLKDFALTHGFNGRSQKLDLQKLARPLLFVPPSMPLGILLQKMQAERIHMALVIDEYGGTDGLLTIEDLIEQVVGEIEDEHDVEEVKSWVVEEPGCYLAQAKTSLDDFQVEIGINLTDHAEIDDEEVETLGGLVFMLLGHVPVRGEVAIHPNGPEFEVLDADPRRIKNLRVRVPSSVVS
jgi:magnesium and cobalt transporter